MKTKQPLTILLILSILIICGCGENASDSAAGKSTGSGTATGSISLTLGVSSNVVTFGTPQTATAALKYADGSPVQNCVVNFTASGNLVTFTPVSATALTNAGGIATIGINGADINAAGAVSITAAAEVTSAGNTTNITSAPVGVAVNSAAVTINSLTMSQPSISAYGTSSAGAVIWVNGAPATVPISVEFTSPCVAGGKATLTSPVTTIAGTATSTYKDNGCAAGTDTITASVTGATASVPITVAVPTANNIQFVSATPAIIGTQTAGAATLPKSSLVKFKVVDSNNNGKPGVVIDFSLSPLSAPGGITLSNTSATSDAAGEVTTSVTSGTVPTPVWVVARVRANPTILSQSNTLTITTGLPTQNFFSLSAQTFNIEGLNYDGVESKLTVIASDRLGNPVPDGTAFNFVTEGGQITPASCATTSGACTVTFRSAERRPADGRVTMLAYALGEESFIDANGNNSYDVGETFYNMGDPYIDANENGLWDPGEQFIPLNLGSSACLQRPSGAALPPVENALSKQNTCSGLWGGQNYVRRSTVIVLSGSRATLNPTTVTMAASCRRTFVLTLTDVNSNPMPAGTTVATGANYVYYTPAAPGATAKATVGVSGGSPVLNAINPGGTQIALTVEADCTTGLPVAYPAGVFNVEIKTPKGDITVISITVN